MFDNRSVLGVARVIRMRAEGDHRVDLAEPSALAQYVAELAGIDVARAERLCWGEVPQLEAEELDRLANVFELHRDLLAVLLVPTSHEIIEQTLWVIDDGMLNIDECPVCEVFSDRIGSHQELDEDALIDLCLEILAHVVASAQGFEDARFEPPADVDEAEDRRVDQLLSTFFSLDEAARDRVVAFAYQEMAGIAGDPAPARFSGYSHLRQRYLSPLARRVFDELAASEDGVLERDELVRRLGLENARPLGQLQRSLLRSLGALRREGFVVEEEPLVISHHDRRATYALSASALSAWRAFLRAETAAPAL